MCHKVWLHHLFLMKTLMIAKYMEYCRRCEKCFTFRLKEQKSWFTPLLIIYLS